MSGFLPDLASWALRGGAGNRDDDEEGQDNNETTAAATPPSNEPPLTAEELRAQRLARMEELQRRQQEEEQQKQQQEAAAAAAASSPPEPMDVDDPSRPAAAAAVATVTPKEAPSPSPLPPSKPEASSPQAHVVVGVQKKKKARAEPSASDSARKLQRKKELLLKKVLSVTLQGSNLHHDHSCITVDIDSTEISVQTIAEILATRLSLGEDDDDDQQVKRHARSSPPKQPPLVAYLGQAHRRAGEELKTLQQQQSQSSSSSRNSTSSVELVEILQEIQRQVVSYAASCLMEPDIFEAGADATAQLANCLLNGMSDLSTCITFGVTGSASSFYYLLVEELLQQDAAALDKIVGDVVDIFSSKLLKCESVLDGVDGTDGMVLVSAISALCLHKRAAEAVTKHSTFLLPAAGTTQADEVIRPPIPSGNLLQMLAGEHRPYKKRSGPALEKQTLLGAALRLGVPKNNAAFSPSSILNQSLDSVERTTSQQRRQLRAHQEACCQMVLSLVKAGPDARSKVMQWFIDALLVNVTASAMRPDPSKVSSTNLLLNLSVVLLKLCDPFVDDERKMKLIDAGFVSSAKDHGGVFATTGDDAVPRLGENAADEEEEDGDATMSVEYNPKNTFIPQCFFLCARSLHLGIGPALSYHESLLRHIGHMHWELSNAGRELRSEPQFALLISKQRSAEVALFQEEMVTDTCRFCNFMALVLLEMDDNVLRSMPEDFVSDLCGIILSIVKLKAKLLNNIELGYVFKLVVKLLSAKYASMVRNYNLRAMLGDVLYDLYLPPDSSSRRDVPNSVWTDSFAGGQPYLLADATAQETLAPSLLLLYGEVEYTGYYDKMSHRAKIVSVIKYLWESSEHRPAFRRITQNKESFIMFANGIINETNTLIATVMQKLPEIRSAQLQMKNTEEWGRLNEEEQNQITSRLDDSEREVKHALPLCNKTVQMFSYLNTDAEIRKLFLMDELCPRLVKMLLHVLVKLVGSKGLDLKVDNPEQYDFRPKEMLRDLCAIFALFSSCEVFQLECAKAGCDPMLLRSAVKTCRRLNLLTGESMTHFEELPGLVEESLKIVAAEEDMLADAPDEFLDELMSTFMTDPVVLPSGHYVDRSTIMQHLLNDKIDPFSREPLSMEDVKPATELKKRMDDWLEVKRAANKSS